MTDIAEVSKTQASHLVDENRVSNPCPERASLARDIDDDDVFHAGPDRTPSLPKCNSPEDDRVAQDRSDIVVSNVIVAYGDGVRRGARSYIKVRVRDDFGLAPGVNEKT